MISKTINTSKRPVLSKIIGQLSDVEKIIERTSNYNEDTQMTFLLKLGQYYGGENPETKMLYSKLKAYWKMLLGPETDFGLIYNAEIGTIFIAGPLAEIFLYNLERKKLGELSGGPYGILRGLGIPEEEATTQIKKLNEGLYLLLIKGNLKS